VAQKRKSVTGPGETVPYHQKHNTTRLLHLHFYLFISLIIHIITSSYISLLPLFYYLPFPNSIQSHTHFCIIFCNNLCLEMRSDAILNQEKSLFHFRALLQFRLSRDCNNVITLLQLSLYVNTFLSL
jgi:hypothetical protein